MRSIVHRKLRRSLHDCACVLRSTSRAVGSVSRSAELAKLPPPPPDVVVAPCPSSFSFSRYFTFRRREPRVRMHIYVHRDLYASHDIPLVRVSNGTVHNSRVSGGVGYPDIKVEPRSGTRPW